MSVIGPDKATRTRSNRLRIGIDVGGTFTDFLVMDHDGNNRINKVLSTPADPSVAVMNGLTELAQEQGEDLPGFLQRVDIIVHGTTVTTNASGAGSFTFTLPTPLPAGQTILSATPPTKRPTIPRCSPAMSASPWSA